MVLLVQEERDPPWFPKNTFFFPVRLASFYHAVALLSSNSGQQLSLGQNPFLFNYA